MNSKLLVHPKVRFWLLLLTMTAALAAMSAETLLAQQQQAPKPLRRKKPVVTTPAPAPKIPALPANPQEKPLVDLSEIIGSLAFLTQVCSPTTSPNPWRVRMETLLDTEGENSGVREKMTGAYNHGFADYSITYRQCTEAARTARRVLVRDAARLAREIERRFGV